jgi:hypothetical protein
MNNLVISIKPYILQLWWLGQLQEEINLNKPLSSRLFWITKGRGMHRNQKYLIKVSTWKEYFFWLTSSILPNIASTALGLSLSCGGFFPRSVWWLFHVVRFCLNVTASIWSPPLLSPYLLTFLYFSPLILLTDWFYYCVCLSPIQKCHQSMTSSISFTIFFTSVTL